MTAAAVAPVVKTYPKHLYGESPVKTIVLWMIAVVIMTQFVSWYIAVGLETALYGGMELMAAAAANAAAVVGQATTPQQFIKVIQSTIDAGFARIDLVRNLISIPVLILIGFIGSHYLLYTILACLLGILVSGSIIIGSISGLSNGEENTATALATQFDPWKIIVSHGLIESVFVPVLMVASILFMVGFVRSCVRPSSKIITPTIGFIILVAMGIHNLHNTRMGMSHGWLASWSSLRIGMIVALVILGPLFAAGIIIRIKLIKSIPQLESSVPVLAEERWKTLQVLGILVGIICTIQEVVFKYYNAAMVQVVGTGLTPFLSVVCGVIGVVIYLYVVHFKQFNMSVVKLEYIALGISVLTIPCFLLPVAALNNFFSHGRHFEDLEVRASGALVFGLLILYTAFPILMTRVVHLALRHTRRGYEFMAKCLLLAFFAINRILPNLSYHNNRHAAWSHIVTSIGFVIASGVYIWLDAKQEARLALIVEPPEPAAEHLEKPTKDIERQISLESLETITSTLSSIPTLIMQSPRRSNSRSPEGTVPPNNSLRYPTISTFDEF